MSLNKTKIEWADFTANPVRGKCPHFGTARCGTYCYAEKKRRRFREPEELSFHPEVLDAIARRKKPATIFVGSTIDLFASEIPVKWTRNILHIAAGKPALTFIFLSKNPYELQRRAWKYFRHNNLWWGITATHDNQYSETDLNKFSLIQKSTENTFISLEPIGETTLLALRGDGARTFILGVDHERPPFEQDVCATLKYATGKSMGGNIFIKDNLYDLYPDLPKRRELPWELHTK